MLLWSRRCVAARNRPTPCGVLATSFVLVLAVFLSAGVASATSLQLSNESSDSTPAGVLDAVLDFAVAGSTLTLTVTNETAPPSPFSIQLAAFNATPNVSSLSLDSVGGTGCVLGDGSDCGWQLSTLQAVNGFGVFDFVVETGSGIAASPVAPGESLAFVFGISGVGAFHEAHFTTRLSTIPPGKTPSLAAAKFVMGPGDDSAYGAVIPEPSSFSLLGLGLLGLVSGARPPRGSSRNEGRRVPR